MVKDLDRKIFGYYEVGDELLIPITNERAAVVRVEKAGKKGCFDCYMFGQNEYACVLFPCIPAQRADKQMAILKKIGEVDLCG